jgi:AraC-like DNA-binding protein
MLRTPALLADGNDDFVLPLHQGGISLISARGEEVIVDTGSSVLVSSADSGAVTCNSMLRASVLTLPRKAITPLVIGIEDIVMRPLPSGRGALRLLRGYFEVLQDDAALATPELRSLAVTHVYDLVALALGATGDAAAVANMRGLRAARLREVLAALKGGYADAAFGVEAVALKLRLSPRYVWDLLHESGAGFTERVLELRLRKAREMLADRRHDRLKVIDIANACGFDSVSYFNRCFRRRFGASPTQYRGSGDAAD